MAADVVSDGCPELVRLQYSTTFPSCENSGVTEEALQIIMEGGVSKHLSTILKCCYVISAKITACDAEHCTKCIDHYCQKSGCRIEDILHSPPRMTVLVITLAAQISISELYKFSRRGLPQNPS
jgi:hypothetical protein